jgi:putative ABC transport system permease protein
METSAKEVLKMRNLGMIKQSVVMSIQNIIANKMRTFLTMLGIIIGVGAVIALITSVSAVTDYIMEQFSSLGAGTITISAPGTSLKYGLSENDLSEIEEMDNVKDVAPSVTVTAKVVRNDYVSDDVTITGKNEAYFQKNDEMVTYGRSFTPQDMDGTVTVCLIDDELAKTFFLGEDPLGKTIRVGGITYTVVGLCNPDDTMTDMMVGVTDSDGTIYIPYKNAMNMNGTNRVNSLEVYVEDTDKTDELVDRLEAYLDNAFNDADNAYSIINMDSLVEMMDDMSDMMTKLLAGIASISLLVGGIGIMNMMLVSVTERTKEIGLRKALGAEPGIIQLQFLIESIILSLLGGIIGILFGELLSYIALNAIDTEFRVNVSAVALGFFFSLGVGVIFGWAPARKASNLNPIDALRSE